MWLVWILCVIAAVADMAGGFITVFRRLTYRQVLFVTGLGAGFLLGATVLDRLPESISEMPATAPVFIVVGYLLMYLLNQAGGHRHSAVVEQHQEAATLADDEVLISTRSAVISFVGLLLHTFMDGVIIAGAFSINRATGILMFFAIALHKLPEGFSMATLTLAAGSSRGRAFLASTGLAVSTLIGAGLTLGLGNLNTLVIRTLMAIATGTFLYVSTSDLIPALGGRNRLTIIAVLIGVAAFEASLLLIHHAGLS